MSIKLPRLSLGEGRDRLFNLLALALVAILIVGLCLLGFVALFMRPGVRATPAPATLTPPLARLTPVATWTFTPTPILTPTPTFTPVLAGIPTPTPTPTPTPLAPTPTPTSTPTATPPTGYGLPLVAVGAALFFLIVLFRKLRS